MPSFETGVRLLKNILIKKRSYSAFFADETDALHKAFPAKATVHAGPFGIPMLWNSARNFLEKSLLNLDKRKALLTFTFLSVKAGAFSACFIRILIRPKPRTHTPAH